MSNAQNTQATATFNANTALEELLQRAESPAALEVLATQHTKKELLLLCEAAGAEGKANYTKQKLAALLAECAFLEEDPTNTQTPEENNAARQAATQEDPNAQDPNPAAVTVAVEVLPEAPVAETVVVSVGEVVAPETPTELPDALQAMYRAATQQERDAFDALLALASKPKKAALPVARQSKAEKAIAKAQAGCGRIDFFALALFGTQAPEEGVTVDQLVQGWCALAGLENVDYVTRRMTIHLKDATTGSLGRKCFNGNKITFDPKALANDVYKPVTGLAPYKAEAARLEAELDKEVIAAAWEALKDPKGYAAKNKPEQA